MAKKKLYKTADEIIAGYSLTSSKVHRKVYLVGRPLKTGNVSLVRYHSSGSGKFRVRERETTGVILCIEKDQSVKLENQEKLRLQQVVCDTLNADLEREEADFKPLPKTKALLSDYAKELAERSLKETGNRHSTYSSMNSLAQHSELFRPHSQLGDIDKQLRKEEVEVKMMASQSNINLYPLSTNEQFEFVDCKTKIATLDEVELHTREQIEQLSRIKNAYQQVCGKIKELGDIEEDDLPTAQMLSVFRKLLRKFNYTSNNVINEVFFKEENTTYKYLPVIKHGENNEEEIRADSSASDFIRSIWAYYLTLLTDCKRHPGFLVMDEPCQHSMKEASLTHLFEVCASITNKQTILFCSSQPKTEENEEETDEQSPNLIEELSNMVKEKGLNFNYIGIDPKAITLIND